jgi:hypothetical protein
VASRPRDQDGELFDQFSRLEDNVRRAIAPGVSKPVCDPPIGELVQPLSRDRRPGNVSAQSLDSFSIPAANHHSRVQAQALNARALLPDPRLHILDLDAIAEPHDTDIHRLVHEGQNPRPLHEKATSRSSPQVLQRTRRNPWARIPQAR